MVARVLRFLFIQTLFYTVMASYLSQAQQYYQMPGQQYYQVPNAQIPTTNTYTSYTPPTHQSAVTSPYIDYSYSTTPLNPYKPPDIPSLKPLELPNANNSPVERNPSTVTPIDTNVLNNLAIALQLLIVSNLLNSPIPDKTSIHTPTCQSKNNEYDSVKAVNPVSTYNTYVNPNNFPALSDPSISYLQPNDYQVYFDSNHYDQTLNTRSPIPNANYLGSHNFGDLLGSYGVPPATARPGLNLKSPYDVMASTSLNAPSTSFEYTKKDLQSPYAAIMAADNYKDLFSIDF